jgi:hypothetical protein
LADRLSFYKAEYAPLVLAPRGWQCSGRYGSGGGFVLVVPDEDAERATAGPAVYAAIWIGGTSGRMAVGELRARTLPRGLSEPSEPIDEVRPFPGDVLMRGTPRIVEYTTPANTEGLGTEHAGLEPSALPVHGVVRFEGPESELNARLLAVRLPAELDEAIPVIVAHAASGASESD